MSLSTWAPEDGVEQAESRLDAELPLATVKAAAVIAALAALRARKPATH